MDDKKILTFRGQLLRLAERVPMLRVALALALGILFSEWWPLSSVWLPLGLLLGGVVVLWLSTASCRSGLSRLFLPALWITLTAVGWLLALAKAPADPFPPSVSTEQLCIVRLDDPPRPTAKCYKVPARVEQVAVADGWCATSGKVLLYIRRDSASATLACGSRLWLRCRPERPVGPDSLSGFDYRRYLRHKGILWQCYVPSTGWAVADTVPPRSLRCWARRVQWRMVERLRQCGMNPWQQGVAEALLLGWRDDVSPAAWQQFRSAGIAHLLCVSGLHVGIVAWLLGACLFFLRWPRWRRVVRGVVQIGGVWLFVLLTGMAPSTLRAGVMFTLLLLGDMAEGQRNTLNNLFTSMVLLLVADPMSLFDAGFQLSYTAVIGIVAWQRPLCRLLPVFYSWDAPWWLWPFRRVWELVCLSVVAQLATLPLMLLYFHQFPTYFLIANLVVVPFAALLLLAVMGVLLTTGVPWLCHWLTALLDWLLSVVDLLTRWVSQLPYALLSNLYFDRPMALLLSVALLLFTVLLCGRRLWALPAMLVVLLLLASYWVWATAIA